MATFDAIYELMVAITVSTVFGLMRELASGEQRQSLQNIEQ
jgi:hypothetical protein